MSVGFVRRISGYGGGYPTDFAIGQSVGYVRRISGQSVGQSGQSVGQSGELRRMSDEMGGYPLVSAPDVPIYTLVAAAYLYGVKALDPTCVHNNSPTRVRRSKVQ